MQFVHRGKIGGRPQPRVSAAVRGRPRPALVGTDQSSREPSGGRGGRPGVWEEGSCFNSRNDTHTLLVTGPHGSRQRLHGRLRRRQHADAHVLCT